jgi:capsid protein
MAWYHHLLRSPFVPAAPAALPDPAPTPQQPQITRLHPSRVRSFAAGTPSRLTAGFVTANSSLDADLLVSLNTLRARSRHLTQNNPYGVKYLAMVSANIVGHQGFTLQARCIETKYLKTKALLVTTPDNIANRAIESAFAAWSARGVCEVTGKHSFSDLCRLFARTVAGDGEVLVRRLRGKSLNPFGYALRIRRP